MDSVIFKQKVAYWLERHQFFVVVSDHSRGPAELADMIAVTPYPGFVRIFTNPNFFNEFIKHPMTEMPKDSHAFPRVLMIKCFLETGQYHTVPTHELQERLSSSAKLLGCEAVWATCNSNEEMQIRWIHPHEDKELMIE